jgi:DNA-directed RNA polymerase specialized sigma24 family protein
VFVRPDDEQRYTEYVSSRLPWLRKIGFLLCQDWHRADDLAQGTITKLYVHWRRASRADNLDAYVRTMLVREYLSQQRTAWASRVDLGGDGMVERPWVDGDHAIRLAVRTALADVAPRQRATLVLRFYCDLSVEEAADVLRCSAGTVKSQTARGLDSLRRALDARQITVEG